LFFFFFSSRRRHTRSYGDWSSDVCSSDLYTDRAKGFVQAAQSLALREGHQQFGPDHLLKVLIDDPEGLAAGLIERAGGRPGDARSEERRVGKEGRCGGGGEC